MTERHLLFAVLAFECELIDLAQLTAACRAWAEDKSKPLADLLIERGWITADACGFVEMQLERKLAKHQHDPRVTLNSVVRGDVCDAIKQVEDADIQQSLSSWPSSGPVLIETIGETQIDPSRPKSRYTWISEVGKGGLGRVWLAKDNDLAREVALKEIRPDKSAASTEAVRRLIKEAPITGQLQHPNIVPVYEVNRGGRPFYTMKLVKGETLSKAIHRHHEQVRVGREDPLSLPRLLNVFVNVCEAIAYAHSRGIIHRDLKPENIVLGDYGEAIVLDWGLAKQIGSADEETAPVLLTEDAQSPATRLGATPGTPAYMSPEQAAGRVDLIDQRTDVYGLGTILFEILTGHAPHRAAATSPASGLAPEVPAPCSDGADDQAPSNPPALAAERGNHPDKRGGVISIHDLLRRIGEGDTPRARELDATISRELDAICATAMAKKRDDRYVDAKALAADIKRSLAHQPVSVYRTGPWERLRLWRRRNPVVAALSLFLAVSLLTGTVASTLFGFAAIAAKNAEAAAKTEESKAKNDALVAQQTAEKQQAAALRENANHYWRLAINLRDSKELDPIGASLLFLHGAKSLGQIVKKQSTEADEAFRCTESHAAGAVDRSCVRTWAHDGYVLGCTFSRDESRMVTCCSDGIARLWDVTKSEPIQTFKHDAAVWGAQFSGDETRVLTWSGERNSVQGVNGGEARLWDVTRSEPIQIFKHDLPVYAAQFSQDEFRVLTWSSGFNPDFLTARDNPKKGMVVPSSHMGEVRWWDVTKSQPPRIFKHDGLVSGAQFSRDELRVLTWGYDESLGKGEARLLDLTKPDPIQIFKHGASVRGAQFSQDESRVLTWSDDKTARLWDVTKLESLQEFKHDERVTGAQFSHDQSRVLTWSHDKTARLWDVTKSEPLQTFKHDSGVNGAQFNGDESRVLTWINGNAALLWDVTKSEPLQTFKHDSVVLGAQFSQELRVLTWSGDKTARLWDVTKTELLQTFKHGNFSVVIGAQFSRDGSRVLTYADQTRLWDVTKPVPLQTFKDDGDGVWRAQFSRDETRLLTSGGKTARLWDVTKPDSIQTFKHDGEITVAQFSRDESRVLTWSDDKTARLWEVTKPEPLQTFKHDEVVLGARFSRDESRLLTWSGNTRLNNKGEAQLWDVTKSEPLQTFKHEGAVIGTQFREDESRVLTWSGDKKARLWDMTQSEPLQTFKHDEVVLGARFSRDESRVLTWSTDKTARLWDVTKSEPLQTFKHVAMVWGAQFLRDDSCVLTWSQDETARLWDVSNPEPLHTFTHAGQRTSRLFIEVNGPQFSRDESRMLTWNRDNTVRLWDVTKAEPLQTFKHDSQVRDAQFSPDESRVLSWSHDGTARLWNALDPLAMLTPDERIVELEVRSAKTLDANLKLRTLSFAEWQAKVKSPEYRAIEKRLPR